MAYRLIEEDPRNADVLHPYLVGADLNRHPNARASRWIINFQDWPLERAETYPVLFDRVLRLVKPSRDRNKRQVRRDNWWKYAERAPELYRKIASRDSALAMSQVGSVALPVRVPADQVFDQRCVVFALNDNSDLAVLSSSAHQVWTLRYASTLRNDITYNQSLVFTSFPRPATTRQLDQLGRALDEWRSALMLDRALGLTKLYNQVHDPSVTDPAIVRLRELHEQIDYAVLAAYGWDDLDPEVGHHLTKIGVRWTVSPEARFELLDRLLVENHRRAAQA
jgi:hypothetical protein